MTVNEEMASQFHRATAQMLFLCLRARPDVQTAVSFFTTRVRSPDMDDWKKLRHCMKHHEVSAFYQVHEKASQCGQSHQFDVVGRWLTWCALGLKGTYRSYVVHGQRSNSQCVAETQTECWKFNRVRVSKYCGCLGRNGVVQVFHGGPRIYN